MKTYFLDYKDSLEQQMAAGGEATVGQFKPPNAALHEALQDLVQIVDDATFIKKSTIAEVAMETGIIPKEVIGEKKRTVAPPVLSRMKLPS